MIISGDDIIFVYSGGPTNADPSFSLGGDPSANQINDSLNNLFADVSEAQSDDGYVDYRCFYIFNDSNSDTLYAAKIYLQTDTSVGNMAIGTLLTNDVQQVSLGVLPTGGSFVLSFDDSHFTVNYDSDPVTWANNFQAAINGVGGLSGVVVTNAVGSAFATFKVTFSGNDGNKNQPLLSLVSSSLSPTTPISISKTVEGGPLNYITNAIQNSTNVPTDATFGTPTADTPFLIGNIGPGEGFPIWIRRTVPAGSPGLVNNGFTIEIDGETS